jgi:hypothetical protein
LAAGCRSKFPRVYEITDIENYADPNAVAQARQRAVLHVVRGGRK